MLVGARNSCLVVCTERMNRRFLLICALLSRSGLKFQKRTNEPLPPGLAGKKYSGKFNLRLGRELHESLVLAAMKEGKSLNAYCAEVLETKINR